MWFHWLNKGLIDSSCSLHLIQLIYYAFKEFWWCHFVQYCSFCLIISELEKVWYDCLKSGRVLHRNVCIKCSYSKFPSMISDSNCFFLKKFEDIS